MKIFFHNEAEKELFEIIDYYENLRTNLGLEFVEQLDLAIEKIRLYPEAWTEVEKGIRRCLINRFPFGILYMFDKKENIVYILAIMHLSRDPDYWKKRIKDEK